MLFPLEMTQTITGKGESRSKGHWRCTGDGNITLEGFSCATNPAQSQDRADWSEFLVRRQAGIQVSEIRGQAQVIESCGGDGTKSQGQKCVQVILQFGKRLLRICTFSLLLVLFLHQSSWRIQESLKSPFHSIEKRKFMSNAMQDGGYSPRCALYNLKLKKTKSEWSRLPLESYRKAISYSSNSFLGI